MTKTKLLVVDDNTAFAEFVRMAALDMGFDVELAADGALGKKAYTAFDPDVIVLDMVMPVVDGTEYIQWLAAENSKARLIIVTGYNPKYAEVAKLIGMAKGIGKVTCLNKPVQLPDLRKALADDAGE